MRVTLWIGLALTLFASVASARSSEESSLRCSGGLVEIGDPEYELREKCGPPRAVEAGDAGPVLIYDFGPTTFVYSVYLSDGKVARIQSGDYGTEATPPRTRSR